MGVKQLGNEVASEFCFHNDVHKTITGLCTYGSVGINLHTGSSFGDSDGVAV